MKNLSFFLLSFVALSFVSCDNVSKESKVAFVGEYWMETSSFAMKGDKVVDTLRTKWSPVDIYEENGKLLVRTNWYGAPYLSDDNEHAEPIEAYNERADFVSSKHLLAEDGEEEGEGDIIDVIVTDNKPIVIVQNGQICVIRSGEYWKSEPIKVKSGTEKVLNLEPFKKVDVQLTDGSGNALQTIQVWYEYGPIIKKENVISWQVDLVDNYTPSEGARTYDRVVHKNTLYKR